MSEAPALSEALLVRYLDDDLVYVNPDTRTVVGPVTFLANGMPNKMPIPMQTDDVSEEQEPANPSASKRQRRGKRSVRVRYCPWGTYRSMKHTFKLEGKPPRVEVQQTLEEVMEKALHEPFWD